MINQQANHDNDSAYFDNCKQAKAMCEEAIAKFTKSKGTKNCQSIIKSIEEPQIEIELNQVQLPNEAIPAVLEYKNVTHLYYKIVKVSEKEFGELKEMWKGDMLKELNKKMAVAEE